jgi:hypothetical protein
VILANVAYDPAYGFIENAALNRIPVEISVDLYRDTSNHSYDCDRFIDDYKKVVTIYYYQMIEVQNGTRSNISPEITIWLEQGSTISQDILSQLAPNDQNVFYDKVVNDIIVKLMTYDFDKHEFIEDADYINE